VPKGAQQAPPLRNQLTREESQIIHLHWKNLGVPEIGHLKRGAARQVVGKNGWGRQYNFVLLLPTKQVLEMFGKYSV
jgi:hypothetical protein